MGKRRSHHFIGNVLVDKGDPVAVGACLNEVSRLSASVPRLADDRQPQAGHLFFGQRVIDGQQVFKTLVRAYEAKKEEIRYGGPWSLAHHVDRDLVDGSSGARTILIERSMRCNSHTYVYRTIAFIEQSLIRFGVEHAAVSDAEQQAKPVFAVPAHKRKASLARILGLMQFKDDTRVDQARCDGQGHISVERGGGPPLEHENCWPVGAHEEQGSEKRKSPPPINAVENRYAFPEGHCRTRLPNPRLAWVKALRKQLS